MMKKYLVCPGYVRSITDGQQHYISYGKLIKLYDVNPEECTRDNYNMGFGTIKNSLTRLEPLESGYYKL